MSLKFDRTSDRGFSSKKKANGKDESFRDDKLGWGLGKMSIQVVQSGSFMANGIVVGAKGRDGTAEEGSGVEDGIS